MQIERYKKLLAAKVQAKRFRPFTIRLENGESYRITHPENVAWGPDGYTMVYVRNELRAFLSCDAVTTVEGGRDGRR